MPLWDYHPETGLDRQGKKRPSPSGFTPQSFEYEPPGLTDLEDIETGGQSTRRLLTSTLEEAKRRARLTGRTLSAGETEGLTRAHFGGAESRLAQRRGLALQKRGQEISVRGQDISAELAYTGLTSRERMHEAGLETQLEAARIGAASQAATVSETSGFFGGGGFLGLGCIIITACTNSDSEEVNIVRRYRDKIMLPETLRGYYMIAEKVVPLIHKSDKLKRFLKKHLVDSLATTCEWKLKETHTIPSWKARIITGLFLGTCCLLGNTKSCFVRYNGETI